MPVPRRHDCGVDAGFGVTLKYKYFSAAFGLDVQRSTPKRPSQCALFYINVETGR